MRGQKTRLSATDAPTQRTELTLGVQLKLLRKIGGMFLEEIRGLGEAHDLDIEGEFNYYEEVRLFEIDIIKCALRLTGGHQVRAARLLGLKTSTLNNKLKLYGITIKERSDSPTHELAFIGAAGALSTGSKS